MDCLGQVEVSVCPVCKEPIEGKKLARNSLAEKIVEALLPFSFKQSKC